MKLSEGLASIALPPGSVLIVLSQPGMHLAPLEKEGAITIQIPKLNESEIRQLASQLGVELTDEVVESDASYGSKLIVGKQISDTLVATLVKRSAGNALYVTYLCREILRDPVTLAMPESTVLNLPSFSGSLEAYYEHVQISLGDKGAWVADVLALIDFPVSRAEIKKIRPDMAHRVDSALEVMKPVLVELVTQAGVRIYHESFARFLRLSFQSDPTAGTALLVRVIDWLDSRGIFKDLRAFRHLIPTLVEVNFHQRVVDLVGVDFVNKSIASGFPALAIVENLAVAISSAAYVDNWPAVARYVEMSRSVEAYQEERFESVIVRFADVVGTLIGVEVLAERLLNNGRPVMVTRSGLQMCATLDACGAVVPWKEYMTAHLKESAGDQTIYCNGSDTLAWMRGRLRLALSQSKRHSCAKGSVRPVDNVAAEFSKLYAPVDWRQLARFIDENNLPAREVIRAIVDTFGLLTVIELIGKLDHPGPFCLALAELISAGSLSDSEGGAHYWASNAAKHGLPHGNAARLITMGLGVEEMNVRPGL